MNGSPPAGPPYFLVDRVGSGTVVLDGPEGRHAAAVRRLRVGEHVVLTDGRGGWATGPVTAVGRAEITVDCVAVGQEPPARPRVVVVQALPKGERSDLAVELATEAGADAFVPWAAQRCVARWVGDKADKGVAKWTAVAREAAKQARRATAPRVHAPVDLAGLTALVREAAATWVLHESATGPVTDAPLPTEGDLLLVVGPEGGVSPQELQALVEAGAVPVRLGPQVLRTSTAATVALGALGALGRWTVGTAPHPADGVGDKEKNTP